MRLNHVTVGVSDVERAVAFYKLLGLRQIVAAYPDYARFEVPEGDSTLSLARLDGSAPAPARSVSVHFETDRLDDLVRELKGRGVAFDQDPIDQPYLWREARLTDPDGNSIFLYSAGENRLNPPWRLPAPE
ncbi:MAG TPA: VOC family protein [Solirubrobacteraceae bacterium]|jgi:catechol 2,3-dioxygenase-like lactoylglutathione lyase family enzyme